MESGQSSLYDTLSSQLHRHWQSVLSDAQHGVLSFPPAAFDKVAHSLFSNLEIGGFTTIVVSGRRVWDPNNFYFQTTRRSAKQGKKIIRAFLLPHKQYIKEPILKTQWELDKEAGIDVRFLYIGNMLSSMLSAPNFSLDFGVWDEQLVCSTVNDQIFGDGEPSEWRVSCRKEDVELAIKLRNELLLKAIPLLPPDKTPKLLDLEEPMVQTAPLMELLSNAVCSGSYLGENCSWYHGAWQYLRILDLVSTPTWHPNFYIPQLEQISKEIDNPRILISGTADYSTLAHVLWVFDNEPHKCETTVLDLCQSPLILCQWYASKMNHHIKTVQEDINTFNPDNKFNIIVTDAFLTRFSKPDREEVVKSWFRLLAPAGRVLTTVRINDSPNTDKVVSTSEEIRKFCDKAVEKAIRWKDFLPISTHEISEKAKNYAERIVSHPVYSVNELHDIFESQGFLIREINLVNVSGEMRPTIYAEIAAEKPS